MQTPEERREILDNAIAEIEKNFGKQRNLASIGYKSALVPFKDTVDNSFKDTVDKLLKEAGNLLVDKQNDYGPLNISRAPGGPLNGLRVRIFDKISRINNLIDSGVTPKHESLRDSFIDLANYSIIALMVIDGEWPELDKSND